MIRHPILERIPARGWVLLLPRHAPGPARTPEFNTPGAFYIYQSPTAADVEGKSPPGPEVRVRFALPADREKISWLYTANDGPCYYLVRPSLPLIGVSKTPVTSLDALLREEGVTGAFSHLLLRMPEDPLLKLRGASDLLKSLSVIVLDGVAAGSEVDTFLFDRGFVRLVDGEGGEIVYARAEWVEDPSWFASRHGRRVCLGGWLGRFGNQLFQYVHGRLYGLRRDALVMAPEWPGQHYFALPSLEKVEERYPRMGCYSFDLSLLELWADPESPVDLDLHGYFQIVPPTWSAWYRQTYRRILRARPEVEQAVGDWLARAVRPGETLVALHVRRGDYLEAQNSVQMFQLVPVAWYLRLLEEIRRVFPNLCVYIATNDEGVLEDFRDYEIVNNRLPRPILPIEGWDYLFDFAVMCRSEILGISNSSFSRGAALLASGSQVSFFPSFREGRFLPFSPWSEVAFWHHIAPAYSWEAFSHQRALSYAGEHVRNRLTMDAGARSAIAALQRVMPAGSHVIQFGADWLADELRRRLSFVRIHSPDFWDTIDDWSTARPGQEVSAIVLGTFDPVSPAERLAGAAGLMNSGAVRAVLLMAEPGKTFDPSSLPLDRERYLFHLCGDESLWGLSAEQLHGTAVGDRQTVLILERSVVNTLRGG
ncbi:MAG: hypothetical protein ABT940_01790 [Alphaproteobacteria bacterium]